MKPLPRTSRTRPLARWLLPAVVLALVFGVGGRAVAAVKVSSIAPASASTFDAHEHDTHCKCRSKCRGASCCCGPKTRVATPAPATAGAPGLGAANPCLNADPCGEPGLPDAPSSRPIGNAATLVGSAARRPPPEALRLHPSTCDSTPARRSSRLDDPPERSVVA